MGTGKVPLETQISSESHSVHTSGNALQSKVAALGGWGLRLRYHEANHRKTHAPREAVGAGLPAINVLESIGIPCKKRYQDKHVYPGTTFSRCCSRGAAPSDRGAGRARAYGAGDTRSPESLLP